jgi:hypothetical protein
MDRVKLAGRRVAMKPQFTVPERQFRRHFTQMRERSEYSERDVWRNDFGRLLKAISGPRDSGRAAAS